MLALVTAVGVLLVPACGDGGTCKVGTDCVSGVCNGLGICVLSTSQGVFSDREARKHGVGGEVLCEVW